MYRNIYLECYKSATSQQQNVEYLMCHFSHAYVAMGSILNDIEYAIGKLIAGQRPSTGSVQSMFEQQQVSDK
jgi:hypothetical protein